MAGRINENLSKINGKEVRIGVDVHMVSYKVTVRKIQFQIIFVNRRLSSRQTLWSAQGTPKTPPGTERKGRAAFRSIVLPGGSESLLVQVSVHSCSTLLYNLLNQLIPRTLLYIYGVFTSDCLKPFSLNCLYMSSATSLKIVFQAPIVYPPPASTVL